MKQTLTTLIMFCTLIINAQTNNNVYIKSDGKNPFIITLDNHTVLKSDNDTVVIRNATIGKHIISIEIPNKKIIYDDFTIRVKKEEPSLYKIALDNNNELELQSAIYNKNELINNNNNSTATITNEPKKKKGFFDKLLGESADGKDVKGFGLYKQGITNADKTQYEVLQKSKPKNIQPIIKTNNIDAIVKPKHDEPVAKNKITVTKLNTVEKVEKYKEPNKNEIGSPKVKEKYKEFKDNLVESSVYVEKQNKLLDKQRMQEQNLIIQENKKREKELANAQKQESKNIKYLQKQEEKRILDSVNKYERIAYLEKIKQEAAKNTSPQKVNVDAINKNIEQKTLSFNHKTIKEKLNVETTNKAEIVTDNNTLKNKIEEIIPDVNNTENNNSKLTKKVNKVKNRANINCSSVFREDELVSIFQKLEAKTDDEARLNYSKKLLKDKKCFNCKDVEQLSQSFNTQTGKFDFVKLFFPYIQDNNNYEILVNIFKYDSYRNKIIMEFGGDPE